jgi:hypothetical protein
MLPKIEHSEPNYRIMLAQAEDAIKNRGNLPYYPFYVPVNICTLEQLCILLHAHIELTDDLTQKEGES